MAASKNGYEFFKKDMGTLACAVRQILQQHGRAIEEIKVWRVEKEYYTFFLDTTNQYNREPIRQTAFLEFADGSSAVIRVKK